MSINEKESKKVAVLLTRAQPITTGHIKLVQQMLEEVENVCVVIGSADKKMTKRNPFGADRRLYWTVNVLKKYTEKYMCSFEFQSNHDRVFRSKHLTVFALDDWESEDNETTLHQWGSYLYYNIVSRTGNKDLIFYYGDNPDTIQSWFDEDLIKHIEYRIQDRESILPGVSATKAREYLLKGYNGSMEDFLDIIKYVPIDIDITGAEFRHMTNVLKHIDDLEKAENR